MNVETDTRRLDACALAEIHAGAQAFHIAERDPDELIPDPAHPYMRRWFIQRKFRLLDERFKPLIDRVWPFEDQSPENVYLHRFERSDDDRALHDHPWRWVTVLLDGRYWEHVPADPNEPAGATVRRERKAGDIVVRGDAAHPHRIELIDGSPATTLFLTAQKTREWGFWCERGWRHWEDFTQLDSSGRSRGCG